MIKREDVYRIGQLERPHGVRGEITFRFVDDVFDRVETDHLLIELDGILVPFFIEEYRFKSNEVALLKFEDIDTQMQAREISGCDVFFQRARSGDDVDHLSWSEIVGYKILDAQTYKPVGVVKGVDDSTINVLFEVAANDGREILIPADASLITKVDNNTRVIAMNIPQGLLDL
ncbi:ribosome maturation factor RimM [Hallella colorans]|uniref:Ribosome maturation factor RimM n=1 Tax=Hallella colorans TaxID=1703337 RepID=A0A2U0U529_9BACT|nr:ribosome maturation factor RimM [Hallella colorans]PVX52726.1 16S rRNA processing protein RimM [Hallella colorans]